MKNKRLNRLKRLKKAKNIKTNNSLFKRKKRQGKRNFGPIANASMVSGAVKGM